MTITSPVGGGIQSPCNNCSLALLAFNSHCTDVSCSLLTVHVPIVYMSVCVYLVALTLTDLTSKLQYATFREPASCST